MKYLSLVILIVALSGCAERIARDIAGLNAVYHPRHKDIAR